MAEIFCLPDDFKQLAVVGLWRHRVVASARPRVASAQIGNDGNRVARNRRFRPYSAVKFPWLIHPPSRNFGRKPIGCGPRVFPFDGRFECRARLALYSGVPRPNLATCS